MAMQQKYDSVRLIGFTIPTTPASIVAIGDVTGSGAVAGTYPAYEDYNQDLDARVEVMAQAVDAAFEQLADAPKSPSTLNVFVAPEFYWHSTQGPYVFGCGEEDPADIALQKLRTRFPADKYPDTLFVFGTLISAQVDNLAEVLQDSSVSVRNDVVKALGESFLKATGPMQAQIYDMLLHFIRAGHAYPKVEVRNRALIVSTPAAQEVPTAATASGGQSFQSSVLTTEKYFASNEDFLLWDVTGKQVVTEQSVAYPVLDLSAGDLKIDPFDYRAIFQVPGGPTVGVEICLDHSDQRLRRSVAVSPWQSASDGVDLHLIPSCGMQITPGSVAAKTGGLVFNCDGLYGLDGATAGQMETGVFGGVASVRTDYIDGTNTLYGAHTQIARVTKAAVDGDSAAPAAANAQCEAPQARVKVIELHATNDTEATFAGGAGAVHIYGLDKPLPL